MSKKNTAVSPKGKAVRVGRLGDAQLVANTKPHRAANAAYVAIRVQASQELLDALPPRLLHLLGGDGEGTIMLTVPQFADALLRRHKNPEDTPVNQGIIDRVRDAMD